MQESKWKPIVDGGSSMKGERNMFDSMDEEKNKMETALTLYRSNTWHHLFSTQINPLFFNINIENLEQYLCPQPRLIGDIIPNILSFCDAQTLSRASCVCQEWRSIALSNDLWEHLCKRQFNISSHEIKPRPDPTKRLYVLTHQRFREACRNSLHPDSRFGSGFVGRTSTLPSIPISAFQGV